MVKKVWVKLQAVEAEARQLLEDARLQSRELVKIAQQQKLELLQAAEETAIAEGERLLMDQTQQAQQKQEKHLAEIKQKVLELRACSAQNHHQTVALICAKVIER